MVVGWGGGGPCDFSVSPSPFGLDFGTLDFGTSDSGLTISYKIFKVHQMHNGINIQGFVRLSECALVAILSNRWCYQEYLLEAL